MLMLNEWSTDDSDFNVHEVEYGSLNANVDRMFNAGVKSLNVLSMNCYRLRYWIDSLSFLLKVCQRRYLTN
jgi:hypothetical protein